MGIFGLDFSWGRPSIDAMLAEGYTFVLRYLSYDTTGKNLTKAEADSYINAGLAIGSNWEYAADAALKGWNQGVKDAQAGADQHAACGGPPDAPIYFSVDWDASESQQDEINDYLNGCASVVGLARVGLYAGYWPLKRCLDAGVCTWAWQTYAWSGGNWDTRAHIRQIQNGISVGGADCDRNEAMTENYGQWGSGGGGVAPPSGGAPAFPFGSGHYLGTPRSDDRCHSGYYSSTDASAVRTWQSQMKTRGWSIGVDGQYGPQSESTCRSFQAEKGLGVDGLTGPQTWQAAWTAPVT